jgi:CobQ-like glutamine amidotransferase family enzyme
MITLVHLYPRELGINGDVGNVMALAKRAEWRGMPLRVIDHDPGADLPATAHLVHIGSGPASAQNLVRDDLERIAPELRAWSATGVPFLAIAGGWQLLGESLTGLDGVERPGVGIFPTSARLTETRTVREVWAKDVAGFENYGAEITGATWPVFESGASVATNLHGPFLPMNPTWADTLLERAAALAGVPMWEPDDRTTEVDERATNSRRDIRKRLGL